MKLDRTVLREIALPLAGLFTCIALGGAGLYAGIWLRDQAQAKFDMESTAMTEAETKAEAAVVDRANINAYQSIFDRLKLRGSVGDEQRLPWVEHFTTLSLQGNPAALNVKIEPRRVLEDPPVQPEPLENLQFYASKLTINAKLLHEGDAIQLLKSVNALPGGLIMRQCSLKRNEGTTAVRPYLLEMECSGDLITLSAPPAVVPAQ